MKKYEKMVNKIIKKLEEGVIPWQKGWVGGGRPKNYKTDRPYHGINVLSLNLEAQEKGYSHNLWVTYNQAKDLGGHVKKGESGSTIIFWKLIEKEVTEENEDGEEEEKIKTIPLLRSYTVFNIEQTTLEAEEINQMDDFTPIEKAEKIINLQPNLDLRFNQQRAYFKPVKDYINLPKKKSFINEEEFYSTAFHELIHWTGGKKRLDRIEPSTFGSEKYSKEELVAELGSAILSNETGIEQKVIDNQAAYINNWLEKLKDNQRLLINAAAKAGKAVDYLLENADLDKEENQENLEESA